MRFVFDLLLGFVITVIAMAVVVALVLGIGFIALQVGDWAEARGWDGAFFFIITFLGIIFGLVGAVSFALSGREEA